MPYIEKELVAEIRRDLKKTFPEFKFSIRRESYSSVRIVILEGNIDFGTVNQNVNHYHIDSSYTGKAKEFLQLIADYALKDQKELVYDGDYGSVPNYYMTIRIGEWDKDYVLKK